MLKIAKSFQVSSSILGILKNVLSPRFTKRIVFKFKTSTLRKQKVHSCFNLKLKN